MVLKWALEKAVKIAASALKAELVGSRHSWDKPNIEEAAEEIFPFALIEPDGKTPVGGEKAGKHVCFIPIAFTVSKSPLRALLDLLILVSAFRISLFSKML